MQTALRISFRNMDHSDSVETRVRERAAELERVFDRITACHVVVEAPHRRHHHGNIYHVRIDLAVPGNEIVINRSPSEHHAHEDVYVAVRDAFDAARRRLEEHVRKHRGDVKHHAAPQRERAADAASAAQRP